MAPSLPAQMRAWLRCLWPEAAIAAVPLAGGGWGGQEELSRSILQRARPHAPEAFLPGEASAEVAWERSVHRKGVRHPLCSHRGSHRRDQMDLREFLPEGEHGGEVIGVAGSCDTEFARGDSGVSSASSRASARAFAACAAAAARFSASCRRISIGGSRLVVGPGSCPDMAQTRSW